MVKITIFYIGKIKDKGFAPNIDRQHILDGIDRVGIVI